MTKPLLVTLGDPAGVGPEVAAKLISAHRQDPHSTLPIVFVGSGWGLRKGAEAAGVTLPELPVVGSVEAA